MTFEKLYNFCFECPYKYQCGEFQEQGICDKNELEWELKAKKCRRYCVFKWLTRDGMWHQKTIFDKEEILDFIGWLETNHNVVTWE